jgi:serine/threonine protein kinase
MESTHPSNRMKRIGQYEYAEKIGQGAFGAVYKGKNTKTGEKVVVKTEPYDIEFSSIRHESTIMNLLYSNHCRRIPPTYWYGVIPETRERALVMPLYQESLENFVLKYERRTIAIGGYQKNIMRSAISTLKHIHDQYVVHRDIKPANWMINRDQLLLIDFGMAGFYVDAKEAHIPPANPKKTQIIGTPKYASWNIHQGEEYSRRDDLISVVYVGLFMIYGVALWPTPPTDLESENKMDLLSDLNQWFMNKKRLERVLETIGESWPELGEFAKLAYAVAFDETPDYEKMEQLFLC